jgi:chromosome segregation ATPase
LSTLTKIFALLVSALSLFLCGVVVTFLSSAQDYRTEAQDWQTKAQAAQINDLAAQAALTKYMQDQETATRQLRENIASMHMLLEDRNRQLAAVGKESGVNISLANTAVTTMGALRETIANMQTSQEELAKALQQSRNQMIEAQTQMVELTRHLNSEKVKTEQLENLRRQNLEKIRALEDDNAAAHRQLKKVTLSSSEFHDDEKVSMARTELAGVPIRGEITEIDGDNVSISVGSASGVRKDTRFWITRGDKFLGNLEVVYVESNESVGRLANTQGVVVRGDTVTTGFE